MPFGTSYAFRSVPHMPFWRPICLMAPHLPYGAPSALWCPICLLAPHLPFGAPSAFLVPHLPFGIPSPFWHPTCLLVPPFAFCKPLFLKRPMTKCPAAKRVHGFQFPGCNLWMISSSCATTNQLYQLLLQFLQHLSHVSGCALIQVIILFGHIREIAAHLS
jgi:hypothetical protein